MQQVCQRCGNEIMDSDNLYYSKKSDETICQNCYNNIFFLKKRNYTLLKHNKLSEKKNTNKTPDDRKGNVFSELLSNSKKYSFNEYLKDRMNEERVHIQHGIQFETNIEKIFYKMMKNDELKWTINEVPDHLISWANKELDSGNVAAVDGTNMYPINLISGIFCQVGVGGINYQSDEPSINVQSITSHIKQEISEEEYFYNVLNGRDKRLSKKDVLTAMSYWEFEHCLKRNEEWIFKDGNIVPFHLLGHSEGLNLLEKIVTSKKLIGIIKSSNSPKYNLLGRFLKPGQYMTVEDTSNFYFTMREREFGPPSSLIKRYSKDAQKYLKDYAESIKRGVFKVGEKSYVYEIPERFFEKGIALIMADSMRNPRGLPFLIDLIDLRLSSLFENNVYQNKMQSILLEQGELFENINEREMRDWY